MKKNDTSDRRVDYLAERLKDDNLSEGELAEIKEIIRHEPRARRRLVELLYMAADLWDVIHGCQGQAGERQAPKASNLLRFVTWGASIGLAAAAAVALYLWSPMGEGAGSGFGSRQQQAVIEREADGIAVVTQMSDLRWGAKTTLPMQALESGAPLTAGVIELESGIVQIDFYSGATVILEGPAELVLESADHGRLIHGNLQAHVPPPARGFRIDSEAFDVVDLGTEIAMRVLPGGESEVHVMDGEIEVHAKEGDPQPEQLLITGEAMEISLDGSRREISANPERFSAARRLLEKAQMQYANWREFLDELRTDPSLLVCYDFVGGSSWQRSLPNTAVAAPADTDGAIVGSRWTQGRWPEKSALHFQNSSHRVRLNLLGEFESMTLAAWVRIDQLLSKEVSLLHPETSQNRFIHWTLINADSQTALMHFSTTMVDGSGLESRVHYHCDWNLLKQASLGNWMHLALVYDHANGRVSHFQNGQLIGVNEITAPQTLGIGTADIGNWPYHEWAKDTPFEVRNLNGAIDEFLIFDRALSSEEIQKIAKLGKP